MSDFGELCPMFNTGVFSEVMFPDIKLTDITTPNATSPGNGLIGTATESHYGAFTFGRTVIVTGGFVKKLSVPGTPVVVTLRRHTSQQALGTDFGTFTITVSITAANTGYTWEEMNVTEQTFTATDVLGFGVATGVANDGGHVDLIVRYKEK